MRKRLLRPPERAPRAYWVVRSRLAAVLTAFHARVIRHRLGAALAGRERVHFAQVGANDGVRGDPLRALVLRHPGWRGVFAEPVPRLYRQLVRNYPSEDRLRFLAVAVAERAGVRTLHEVGPDAKAALGGRLPDWHDQIASFDPEHLVRHLGERIRPHLVEREVECLPLGELLRRAELPSLDLLHVDAEGADGLVLSQLDLTADPPRVVLYEHAHLADEERRAHEARLRDAGYRLSFHGGDTLAVRGSRDSPAPVSARRPGEDGEAGR